MYLRKAKAHFFISNKTEERTKRQINIFEKTKAEKC